MNGFSSSRSSTGIRAALSYCVQQVRRYDYHHYLCLLQLPPSMRKAGFALRAFNVETAKAMDAKSDPKLGLMRLLWWQEAVDKVFAKKVIEHPVAQALSSITDDLKMSKTWLKRSVEARIADAKREEHDIPKAIEDLEKYAEDTVSTLLYSTLEAGGFRSAAADHAASHIGKASGLLLLLRSLPHHASSGRDIPYIPIDLAAKHGLLLQEAGKVRVDVRPSKELDEAVYEMASVASIHLSKARQLAATVPREAIPALLPALPAEISLNSLRQRHFNVFDPELSRGILGISPLWFQLKLKWYALRGKY
ncbi:unnamed protein product [Victoria cruziana]